MTDRLRVLIVADDPDIAEGCIAALRAYGFDPEWSRVENEAAFPAHLTPAVGIILSDCRLRRSREAAEEAMRDAATLPEESPHPVFRLRAEGTVLYANPAGRSLLKDLGVVVGDRAPAEWCRRAQMSDANGRDDAIEIRLRGRTYTLSIVPVRGAGYVSVYGHDITDRVLIESVLAHHQTLLRLILETLPVGVWVTDPNGTIILANPAAQTIWGGARYVGAAQYSEYEAWWAATGLPVQPHEWGAARALAKGETPPHDVVRIRTFDGTYKTILSAAAPIRNAEGAILGAVVVNQDVSAHHDADRQLRRSLAHLEGLRRMDRSIVTAAPLQSTARTALRHVRSQIACEGASVTLVDAAARALEVLAYEGEAPPVCHTALSRLTPEVTETLRRGEIHLTPAAGDPRDSTDAPPTAGAQPVLHVPIAADDVLLGSLALLGVTSPTLAEEDVAIVRDIAAQLAIAIQQAALREELQRHAAELEVRVQERTRDLEAANQLLAESSRHKSDFLANMSHELRTPLNSILGFAQILEEQTRGALATKHTRFLANIRASGRHLLQLINDILDISKVEAGKVVLQAEPLAVADSLEDILVIARGLAHKKSQVVHLEIETDLPPLHADPIRFKQILFNLLSNAVKFTAEGGHIEVSARRAVAWGAEATDASAPAAEPTRAPAPEPESCLEIAVRDSGVGIRAEDLPKLFQEFTQLETTRGQHEDGTGLGLALTRRLVELHGGRIRGESDGEGQGATFRVILPWNGEAWHGQSAADQTA